MKRHFISTLLVILLVFPCFSQKDSISTKRFEKINWTKINNLGENPKLWKKLIAPIGLAGLSLSLNQMTTKTNLQNQVREPFNGFHSEADDYLQYVPTLEMYAFDFMKIKARNSVWNQTKYLVISEFFTGVVVHILKSTLKIQRPDNGPFNSFPSGHTSQAFVESQVLFNEFYQTNKLIGLSGYLFSISTGSLRVINNKHWVPDVLMGAGIGILVTNLVYYFKPLQNWNPWRKKTSNIGFYPIYQDNMLGAHLRISL